jgi:hypothetical protein
LIGRNGDVITAHDRGESQCKDHTARAPHQHTNSSSVRTLSSSEAIAASVADIVWAPAPPTAL